LVGLLLVLSAALLLSAGSAGAAPYPGGSIFGGNYAMKRSGRFHVNTTYNNNKQFNYNISFCNQMRFTLALSNLTTLMTII
jgi:hypothetical protein